MAQVTVRLLGRKEGVSNSNFGATFSTYIQIANQNNLDIPKNGFVIEEWTQTNGWEPTTVIFVYTKTVNEANIQDVWDGWVALAAQYGFAIEDSSIENRT